MRDPRAQGSLAGSLLVAHPALRDENFRRTVVLLAAHARAEGAMGVILNRPLGRSLGEVVEAFAKSPLGGIPLYEGGPVGEKQVIFAGWNRTPGNRGFQIHFGLAADKAEQLLKEEPDARLRAYLGHSGWSAGQLERELGADGWIVARPDPERLASLDGAGLWRDFFTEASPEIRLWAEAPDAPEKN